MKRVILSLSALLLCIITVGQVPEAFNYQAIVRDGGDVLSNQAVSYRFSIIKGALPGTIVYSEHHSVTTNQFGLVNLVIGNGTDKTGDFSDIDWGEDSHYLKVEVDPTGGTTYLDIGTIQLLSVPYAIYSKKAELAHLVDTITYSIGLNNNLGGYVFYLSPDNKHGLVASTQDLSIVSTWYAMSNNVTEPNLHSLVSRNFTDWRVPSISELVLLYDARSSISGLTTDIYWSSTELDYPNAWCLDFSTGSGTSTGKNNTFNIRAIRSF